MELGLCQWEVGMKMKWVKYHESSYGNGHGVGRPSEGDKKIKFSSVYPASILAIILLTNCPHFWTLNFILKYQIIIFMIQLKFSFQSFSQS